MQRWLVVAVGMSIGACAGSSRDDNGTGEGGGAGVDAENGGSSMNGGAGSGGSAPSGGTLATGGASSGGTIGNGGTVAGGGAVGGTGPNAGADAGGTTSAGAGNTSSGGGGQGGAGAAGAAGSGSGGCAEPNPAGCTPEAECPPTHRCEVSPADCRPSQCTCSGSEWVCTRDCGGGRCRPAGCPMGCEPEGECGKDRTTWVCTGPGDWNVLVDAGCQDLATQVPRYCCPATFMPECR
jgi:hypothetical protein